LNASETSYDTGATHVADVCRARPPLKRRILTLGFAVILGLVAGWILQKLYTYWQNTHTTTSYPLTGAFWAQQSGVVVGPPAILPGPIVGAELLLAGQAYSLDQGPISLPSGSQFQIRISSPHTGRLVLSAMNLTGQQSSLLWQAGVTSGQIYTSPTLRLEGTRGREALVVGIQPQGAGQPPLIRQIDLWHY